MVILFIISFLVVAYFLVATINNKVAKQKQRNPSLLPAPKLIGILGGLGMIASLFFWLFIVSVGPQEVGVVKTPSGVKDAPLPTGWHVIMPWWDTYPMDRTLWVLRNFEAKYDYEAAWTTNAQKNVSDLQKSTEDYINLLKDYGLLVRDFNERDLTEGQKAKKRFLEQIDAQQKIQQAQIVLNQLKYIQNQMLVQELKSQAELYRFTSPEKYAVTIQSIKDLTTEQDNLKKTIDTNIINYVNFSKENAVVANNMQKTIDKTKELTDAEKAAADAKLRDSITHYQDPS